MTLNGAAARVPLRIAVTSDSICPFCFIGLRKLEKALAVAPSVRSFFSEVQIKFLPYLLDPSLPGDKPVDKRQRYLAKFGPSFSRMEEMMKGRGKELGIDFVYDGPVRSTELSHRLMEAAYVRGGWQTQLAFLNKLFPAYFEHSQDPGDAELLSQLAAEAGVFSTSKEAREFLEGDGMKQEVRAGFQVAMRKGITGVPHFELEAGTEARPLARCEIPGAQEVDTFVSVIERIAAKAEQNRRAALQAAGNGVGGKGEHNTAAAAAAAAAAPTPPLTALLDGGSKASGAGGPKCESCCIRDAHGS